MKYFNFFAALLQVFEGGKMDNLELAPMFFFISKDPFDVIEAIWYDFGLTSLKNGCFFVINLMWFLQEDFEIIGLGIS